MDPRPKESEFDMTESARSGKSQLIKARLEKMNKLIKQEEDHLQSFAFASCSFNGLEFKKSAHGKFRIMWGDVPLLECPVEERVKAMFHLKGLVMTVEDRCLEALDLVIE